jgi:hypothetical protein
MLANRMLQASSGRPKSTVNAVDYDGSTNFLTRGADLTGNADSSTGILSVWLRLDGSNGSDMAILYNAISNVEVWRRSAGNIRFRLRSAGGAILTFETVGTFTAGASWINLLASWNTNAGAGSKTSHLYINSVSDKTVISDGDSAFNVDYTSTNWMVGSSGVSLTDAYNGCMAELYFAPGQFLDFSVQANREKFILGGLPVSLGSDGSTPTGTAPKIYLKNPAASVGTNSGNGGDFTANGSFVNCSTGP